MSAIVKTHCMVCTVLIADERALHKSNTCGKDCARELKAMRRALADQRRCQFCGKPSNPDERKAFQAWRRSHPEFRPVKRGRPKRIVLP